MFYLQFNKKKKNLCIHPKRNFCHYLWTSYHYNHVGLNCNCETKIETLSRMFKMFFLKKLKVNWKCMVTSFNLLLRSMKESHVVEKINKKILIFGWASSLKKVLVKPTTDYWPQRWTEPYRKVQAVLSVKQTKSVPDKL